MNKTQTPKMKGNFMYKIIILFILLASTGFCAEDNDVYWIDKDVTVLAFVGHPHSLKVEPVKYTTFINQKVDLFHKKSGPGIYAFYLPGLVVKDSYGRPFKIRKEGYFLVKKRLLRKQRYEAKVSKKKETKK